MAEKTKTVNEKNTAGVKAEKKVEEVTKSVTVNKEPESIKAVAKEKVQEKQPEAVKKTEEKKPVEKKAAKKAAASKAIAKKEPVKKTTSDKKAAKKTTKTEIYIQYAGKEISEEELVDRVKQIWTNAGHKLSEILNLQLYVKPEDYKAYYVINEGFAGAIEF